MKILLDSFLRVKWNKQKPEKITSKFWWKFLKMNFDSRKVKISKKVVKTQPWESEFSFAYFYIVTGFPT